MIKFHFDRLVTIATVSTLVLLPSFSRPALADSFTETYLGPGIQTPLGITTNYETFDNTSYNGSSLTTTFNGSSITGTYTGNVSILNADQYGGAGGGGKYIAATQNTSYSLTFGSQVNYFGLWFSALDQGNILSFYENNTLLFTFTPALYSQLVGACPTAAPPPNFCGNPNTGYTQDSKEQFAYLNFYDTSASFNKIVFSELPNLGSFESDNQAVAQLASSTPVVGTIITTSTPEPPGVLLLGTGILACAGALRRRILP